MKIKIKIPLWVKLTESFNSFVCETNKTCSAFGAWLEIITKYLYVST